MTRIYNLELQKMNKDNDKHLEENKDEINKAILKRGCKITVRIDKLEYHHDSSTEMNMDNFTYRYFEPEGKSTLEERIYNLVGKVITDDLIINEGGYKTRDSLINTDVEIALEVYDKEQPKLGQVGNYSIYNNLGGKKQIFFHLDIPKETYDYLVKTSKSNDELEFFAQVETPKKNEIENVGLVGHKPDIEGKIYRSVFRSLHSFGKR